ncbi:GvpL/GvpF family gas vesicle protein [Natronorubrum bangense]|uniref:Protein gvpF n=2 Tax=Natronorubrum bangense TaxID=61858 RepID=A0A4D6HH43_9EURY|nr:GvpL/GvpF family gas vesicle protein [Natronorubrum bangense]ELY43557.1 gas vesicle synthesis protein GvpLGvpF [Natronorubrum bangense JCM 10635]QCC53153.1 protein gvpF [Natronorubrum bangense]QCC56155.1 protein gvpF [Natronorubrum bangense]
MTNRYVYGVMADDPVEFETDAVGGADHVYTVSHRRLSAVVSNIDTTAPEETDEDAQRHDDVLREVMDRDGGRTIVPMQFGMAFESDRALKNVLRGARPAFRRAINDIEGRIELGLKLVREENADVDTDAIEEAVEDELEPIAAQSVPNDLFSDRLVFNRSYLVERDDRERFDEAVARFEDEHDDLIVRYTGPFAPYSFVDVKIGAQR